LRVSIIEIADDRINDEKREEGQNDDEEHANVDETSKGEAVWGAVIIRVMKRVILFWLIKPRVIDVRHEGTTCIRSARRVLAVI
jgi:hypothetical protein